MTAPKSIGHKSDTRIADRCIFVESNLAHRIRYQLIQGTNYLAYRTACGLPSGVVHVGFTFNRPAGSAIRTCPLCFYFTGEGTES